LKLFRTREDAARELAGHLSFLAGEHPLVVGIPNPGVQTAAIVAEALQAPLDLLVLDKLSAPKHPDHVVGAVDEHGRISMIQSTARWHHLTSQHMIGAARDAYRKLQPSRQRFRAILPELDVRQRIVLIVNHAVITGARMLGAIASFRDRGAARVIVAAPAGSERCTWQLHEAADMVVIPHIPANFSSVEQIYQHCDNVSDELVAAILQRFAAGRPTQDSGVRTFCMRFLNDCQRVIHCAIDMPPGACKGSGRYPAVIFAHGFESDGGSPRSIPISQRLAKRGIIGVRMSFTGHGGSEGSPEDATDHRMVADLRCVYENIRMIREVDCDRIGLNGSGTGGMIALRFAAQEPRIAAMVIRGPVCGDEVEAAQRVRTPTLIIHAEKDTALRDTVEAINQQLAASHRMLSVPESSRLFGDPVSLELMVGASVEWLVDHLATAHIGRRDDNGHPPNGTGGAGGTVRPSDAVEAAGSQASPRTGS
jgi:putative phosphoribosyl transferase